MNPVYVYYNGHTDMYNVYTVVDVVQQSNLLYIGILAIYIVKSNSFTPENDQEHTGTDNLVARKSNLEFTSGFVQA